MISTERLDGSDEKIIHHSEGIRAELLCGCIFGDQENNKKKQKYFSG